MSVEPLAGGGAAALARAEARARAAIDDLFLAEEARLPDRVRTAAAAMLRACVDGIEAALRRDRATGTAFRTLERAGLLRDPSLIEELVGEAARDWLEERLSPEQDAGRHGLVTRLTEDGDLAVGAAAASFAEAQLRARAKRPLVALPRMLHERLSWLVAAALRGEMEEADLTGAAAALLAEEPLSGAAARLAAALERRSSRVGPLLADALRDRSTALFVAILASAARLDYAQARMVLLEPAETMLWVALRSAGLNRGEMATIGAMLADADPRRDLDVLADTLDRVVALPSAMVEQALAPLRLPAAFRDAVRALEAAR
jgi:hypothetical protein